MFREFDRDFTPVEPHRYPVEPQETEAIPGEALLEDPVVEVMATATPPYPGTPLSVGSTGNDVALMQYDLNAIGAQLYPTLNKLTVDGIFGSKTETTVKQYEAIKDSIVDGIIGPQTWNAIVTDYANLPNPATDVYPGPPPLQQGSVGPSVVNMQTKLNVIAKLYNAINTLKVDGEFGSNTAAATRRFQKQFGLSPDEIIGKTTWDRIVTVKNGVDVGNNTKVVTTYPGSPISIGASGDSVRFIQSYMSRIGVKTGSWAAVTVDGQFGSKTQQMVYHFQGKYGLKPDGVVGSATWAKMIPEFNATL